MSRVSSLRPRRPWPLLASLLAVLLCLPAAGARRKRPRKDKDAPVPARAEKPEKIDPPACRDAGCEPGVKLTVEEEGTPPRPVAAFRYRVRIGEQRIDGSCPRARDEGPPVARCLQGGLLVPFVPEELDVAIEAAALRPLLQTLSPQYESRGGCCQRAEVHLVLRRERSAE